MNIPKKPKRLWRQTVVFSRHTMQGVIFPGRIKAMRKFNRQARLFRLPDCASNGTFQSVEKGINVGGKFQFMAEKSQRGRGSAK